MLCCWGAEPALLRTPDGCFDGTLRVSYYWHRFLTAPHAPRPACRPLCLASCWRSLSALQLHGPWKLSVRLMTLPVLASLVVLAGPLAQLYLSYSRLMRTHYGADLSFAWYLLRGVALLRVSFAFVTDPRLLGLPPG